jgi:hypothetical protein
MMTMTTMNDDSGGGKDNGSDSNGNDNEDDTNDDNNDDDNDKMPLPPHPFTI